MLLGILPPFVETRKLEMPNLMTKAATISNNSNRKNLVHSGCEICFGYLLFPFPGRISISVPWLDSMGPGATPGVENEDFLKPIVTHILWRVQLCLANEWRSMLKSSDYFSRIHFQHLSTRAMISRPVCRSLQRHSTESQLAKNGILWVLIVIRISGRKKHGKKWITLDKKNQQTGLSCSHCTHILVILGDTNGDQKLWESTKWITVHYRDIRRHFLLDHQYQYQNIKTHGGFLSHRCTPKSSSSYWDCPWNKPTILGYASMIFAQTMPPGRVSSLSSSLLRWHCCLSIHVIHSTWV